MHVYIPYHYHARRHAANHAHVRIYINVAYSVYFRFPASSILGLGIGLVVGLGSVLVLFFYCIFSFPMYVKRPKITSRVNPLGGSVIFSKFFFSLFCNLGFGLVLALRLVFWKI